jgi:hypothetical protein
VRSETRRLELEGKVMVVVVVVVLRLAHFIAELWWIQEILLPPSITFA